MPAYARPAGLWLTDRLRGMGSDVNALKQQGTQYIVNEHQECVAIIGNVATAPKSNGETETTGLAGWGIAVLVGGVWTLLNDTQAGSWPARSAKSVGKAEVASPTQDMNVMLSVQVGAGKTAKVFADGNLITSLGSATSTFALRFGVSFLLKAGGAWEVTEAEVVEASYQVN